MVEQMQQRFARDVGIPLDSLAKALPIEENFSRLILAEPDPVKRQSMYNEVYPTVHAIYGKNDGLEPAGKHRLVRLLRRELAGASNVLEIGCGDGEFLQACHREFPNVAFTGIDASLPGTDESSTDRLRLIQSNILDFHFDEQFDLILLDNVWEHIAPADQSALMSSIESVVAASGALVLLAPNRLFGPSDVSRLRDYTYSNKMKATGTHLAEPTYSELIELLSERGWTTFESWLPFRKVKHVLPKLRVPSYIFARVEGSSKVLNLLYKLKWKQQTFLRFDVCILASRPPSRQARSI